jgi:hypothetical protein
MAKNIIHGIMFVGLVNIGILLLISQLTQAVPILNHHNKRQAQETPLQIELKQAATELEREADLTNQQYVFDFNNPPSGVSTGAGGEIVVANVC